MQKTALEQQAAEIADSYLPRIIPPNNQRVSRAKEALILKLSEAGKTQAEIASIVGVSQPTVSRTLTELADCRYVAKTVLNHGVKVLAERVIRDANVDQSLEVLDRLDVAPRKQRDSDTHSHAQVIVLMPGQTQVQPPVIDLSPLLPANKGETK